MKRGSILTILVVLMIFSTVLLGSLEFEHKEGGAIKLGQPFPLVYGSLPRVASGSIVSQLILNSSTRLTIYNYISNSPGVHFRGIARARADEFLENLYNYWQVPTEAHIEFNTIRPSYVTVHEDGTEDVNKIGARYSVKIAGIKLYGPGADFSLSIADGQVYDVELHIPSVFIEEYTDLPLSPQEALDRFLTGNYSIEELGFTTMYGVIPREGQLTIEKVELVYFIDHHSDPPRTYPPLCYMISGTIIGPDPFEDEIIRIDFNELIPVT